MDEVRRTFKRNEVEFEAGEERRIVVLAPGPSLLKVQIPEGPIRVGVNGAVQAVRCDWWAYFDDLCGVDFTPIGNPKIYRHIPAVHKDMVPLRRRFKGSGSLGLGIYLAWILGAEIIDVYGADFEGTEYACPNHRLDNKMYGAVKGYKPSPRRWEIMRQSFAGLQEALLEPIPGYDDIPVEDRGGLAPPITLNRITL